MPPVRAIEPLRLFRTMMIHDRLAARMRPLGAGILGSGATVPARLREVMIDRTCALTGAEYEWGVHAAAFGAAVGLSEEQLRSTAVGAPARWMLGAARGGRHASWPTSCIRAARSPRACGSGWPRRSSAEQMIELIVTAGWYHVIAYLCNGLAIELEDWAMRFPPPRSD